MGKLVPCRKCQRHVFEGDRVCPFCGISIRPPSGAARARRLGGAAAAVVAAAACGGKTVVDETAVTGDAAAVFQDSSVVESAGDGSVDAGATEAAFDAQEGVTHDALPPADASVDGRQEADAAEELDASFFGDEPPPPPPPPYGIFR